jgi:large subunit ribosomal protein L17
MLRNQAKALIEHERIETTVPRAKELRPFVERLITVAKRGIADGESTPKALHARRLVLADIPDQEVVGKLFTTIAPRFQARPGGYTRILRVGFRRGDAADIAQIELVGSEYNPRAKETQDAEEAATSQKKGVGSRLRAAADRLRGKKKTAAAEGDSAAASKSATKGRKKKTTPSEGE